MKSISVLILISLIYSTINVNAQNVERNQKEITAGITLGSGSFGLLATHKHSYKVNNLFGELSANWTRTSVKYGETITSSTINSNISAEVSGNAMLVGYQIGYTFYLEEEIDVPLDINISLGLAIGYQTLSGKAEGGGVTVTQDYESGFRFGPLSNLNLNYYFNDNFGARLGYSLNYYMLTNTYASLYSPNFLNLSLIFGI